MQQSKLRLQFASKITKYPVDNLKIRIKFLFPRNIVCRNILEFWMKKNFGNSKVCVVTLGSLVVHPGQLPVQAGHLAVQGGCLAVQATCASTAFH